MTAPRNGEPEPAEPIGWEDPNARRGRRKPSVKRTWLVRFAIAIVTGLGIGAAAGVATVNKLDPGRPGQPDSLQVMLDSLAQRSNDPRALRRAADSSDAAQRAQHIADSTNLANDPSSVTVPALLNLEEGAARDSLEEAGLATGTVVFQASTAPLGVVVGTSPAVGQRVRAGTPVNLVLSNGKKTSDSTDSDTPAQIPTP